MAAITHVDPAPVSPPGYELNDYGYASADIAVGDPVIITADAPPSRKWEQVVAPATGAVAHGIALKTVKAGGTAEYGVVGEMDGFAGLTRGTSLSIVAGSIDTTAPTITGTSVSGGATTSPAPSFIRAVTASRIRYNLV